jgi:hypothetical protein
MDLRQKWHEGEGLPLVAVEAKTFSVDLGFGAGRSSHGGRLEDPRWEHLGTISRRKRNPLFGKFTVAMVEILGIHLLKKKRTCL